MSAGISGRHGGSLGLLIILILTGCAADRELAILRNDLERMNRRLVQLQVAQEVGQAKPRELVQQELEGERRNIADLRAGLDELRQQVGILAERVEESGYQLGQRMNALEARLATAPPPPSGPGTSPLAAGQPSPVGGPPGQIGQPAGGTPTDVSRASVDAKRVYQAALSDYQRGKFDLASQGFRAYLQQAPQGDVADTAQYYLAESLYSAQDYRSAIAEFERLVRDFSQSPQVPSALLKTGYAYYEVKDSVQGKRALRTLVEKYPFSKEAKLAEERLRLEERTGTARPSSSLPSRQQAR